ncbi:hypothetical protein DPMN_080786 [Dreissena polymorpha]|uniref:Uncharacterized protein n=1 Tax=Dreissena polymorpha TaxID=45954 RepID=A0A9D4BS12_DREPO|nr:hypothetical protein DPMN_080786 [Dreissena polymorpha]
MLTISSQLYKCGVIAFNDSVSSGHEKKWYMGTQQLNEVKLFSHLGLICDESLSTTKSLNDASNKLRGTFLTYRIVGYIQEV